MKSNIVYAVFCAIVLVGFYISMASAQEETEGFVPLNVTGYTPEEIAEIEAEFAGLTVGGDLHPVRVKIQIEGAGDNFVIDSKTIWVTDVQLFMDSFADDISVRDFVYRVMSHKKQEGGESN